MARFGLPSLSGFWPISKSSAAFPFNSSSPGATYFAFSPGRKTTAASVDWIKNKPSGSNKHTGRTRNFIGTGRVIDLSTPSSCAAHENQPLFATLKLLSAERVRPLADKNRHLPERCDLA